MHLWMIAARIMLTYVYLLAIVRLSGKRTIGQATPLDFVTALILGDMIDDMIWAEVPASSFVVGAATIILLHLLVGILCARSDSARRLIEGNPTPVLEHGTIDERGLRQERISPTSLAEMLRGFGVRDVREATRVQVETSGHPSLIYEDWARPAMRADWQERPEQEPEAR